MTDKRSGPATTGASTPGGGASTVSPLMTADELAGWLHCSRRAVYDRVYRGQLPGAPIPPRRQRLRAGHPPRRHSPLHGA
ncbi:MAG: hypothetical protein IPK80_19450 [Nannocystis sp.]|nr:hypothetical protein [Nannocystis sp.]